MKVNEIGVGSQLYATFENGIAYQFIPGDILTEPMAKVENWGIRPWGFVLKFLNG